MNNPIRILHVLGRLNRGGAETLVMNLYRSIDRTKIQFDFVVHTDEICAYDDEIYSLGGIVHRVSQYNGKNHLKYVKQWRALFEEYPEYYIIHGHMRSTAAIYLRIAKRYNRVTIIHSHATGSRGTFFEQTVKNIFQFPIRYLTNNFFSCSVEAAEWLFGKKKSLSTVILKNAIDLERYRYDLKTRAQIRRNGLDSKLVVGHVGSFTKPKNYSFLIDIFYEISLLNKNAVLLLVGDGPLCPNVEAEAKAKAIEDKVVFLGSRGDVHDVLMGMDIFVFPSLFEGFGIAALEAQAVGLPTHVADTLPSEIQLTDLLYFHPLTKPAKMWAVDILNNYSSNNRTDRVDVLNKKGYDISEQAYYLMNYYLKLLK